MFKQVVEWIVMRDNEKVKIKAVPVSGGFVLVASYVDRKPKERQGLLDGVNRTFFDMIGIG